MERMQKPETSRHEFGKDSQGQGIAIGDTVMCTSQGKSIRATIGAFNLRSKTVNLCTGRRNTWTIATGGIEVAWSEIKKVS